MDFSFLPSDEIRDMINSAEGELARRQTQDAFNAELAMLQQKYRDALGIEPKDWQVWEAPDNALDAPGLDDKVEHNEKFYRSLRPCNLAVPGASGYRQVSRQGVPIVWIEPTEERDGYVKGERAIRGGVTYESLCDKNMNVPTPDSPFWEQAEESDE